MFIYHSLSDVVCKWTNASGRCVFENYWKKRDDIEMKFIRLAILIGVNLTMKMSYNYGAKSSSLTKLWAIRHFKYSSSITFWQHKDNNENFLAEENIGATLNSY